MPSHAPTPVAVHAGPKPEAGRNGLAARWAVLCLVVLAGAAVRVWAIDFGLPHTQARPDETQVMDVSLNFLRGNLWPPFYDYPRLYNYALTLAWLAYYAAGSLAGRFASLADFVATWPIHWAPFFLVNRLLSAVAGTLTILAAYGLGRRLAGRTAGLVSAFFLALAYGHVRESHFGTTDTTLALLCAAAVVWLLPRSPARAGSHIQSGAAASTSSAYVGSGIGRLSHGRDAVAALLAGLAAATKYNGVILLVPLGLSLLLRAFPREHGLRLRSGQEGPRHTREDVVGRSFTFARRALVMAACFTLAFAVGVPFVFFDFAQFSTAMRDMASVLNTGLAPRAGLPNGWWYHASVSLRYGLGLPLLLAGLLGVAVTARRDWRAALLAFSFPLAYFAVAGSLGALFVRYALPIVPFLCAGAAVTVVSIATRLTSGRAARIALTAVLAAVVAAPSAARVVAFDRVMARTDNRVVASDWIGAHAEPGATVMVSGSPYGYPQFGRSVVLWPWDRRLRTFVHEGRPVDGRPDWILLQESPLPSTTQPAITALLASGYVPTMTLRAWDPDAPDNLYDLQDAFFVPFAGFRNLRRPGPNFTIYRRADARYVATPSAGQSR